MALDDGEHILDSLKAEYDGHLENAVLDTLTDESLGRAQLKRDLEHAFAKHNSGEVCYLKEIDRTLCFQDTNILLCTGETSKEGGYIISSAYIRDMIEQGQRDALVGELEQFLIDNGQAVEGVSEYSHYDFYGSVRALMHDLNNGVTPDQDAKKAPVELSESLAGLPDYLLEDIRALHETGDDKTMKGFLDRLDEAERNVALLAWLRDEGVLETAVEHYHANAPLDAQALIGLPPPP